LYLARSRRSGGKVKNGMIVLQADGAGVFSTGGVAARTP
jgi:hypothetical protein